MKERPILFSGPMVRAILENRKTQTRRIINRLAGFGPVSEFGPSTAPGYDWRFRDKDGRKHVIRHDQLLAACPWGQLGDRLWARETWRECDDDDLGTCIELRADHARFKPKFPTPGDGWRTQQNSIATDAHRWRPSIHMPRWASRITLETTKVRAQRLQDITEADAIAEGVTAHPDARNSEPHVAGFADLWNTINAARGHGWDTNPWVWAVTFKQVKGN